MSVYFEALFDFEEIMSRLSVNEVSSLEMKKIIFRQKNLSKKIQGNIIKERVEREMENIKERIKKSQREIVEIIMA